MLATLIQTLANGDTSATARRVRRAMIDFLIAGIALTIGFGFFVAAAFILSMNRFGALYTCLGFGAGFIIIAFVALMLHRWLSRMQAKRRQEEVRAAQLKSLAGATAFAILPQLLKRRGGIMDLITPILAMAAYAVYKENAANAAENGDAPPEDS